MTRSNTTPVDPDAAARALHVRDVSTRFAARLEQLADQFVGREEAVTVVGLALLCREHVLLVGPPGTAKTALLNSFARMLSTDAFTYLLTRFTEPSELFGPIDVARFRKESIYRVNTDGMLPMARLAFLDEVFEGSSAILNTLLTLINERVFHNGSEQQRSRLITLLGSSNDVPDDPVLAAFSDRFLLRCQLDYVADDAVEDVLGKGWTTERALIADPAANGVSPLDRTTVRFPIDDLAQLQQAVADVDLTPVRETFADIVRELRGQGVAFSDRRAVKAQKVFAASALLAGRTTATADDLAPLVYLWTDRRDEPALRRALTDHGVAVVDPGRRLRDVAEIRVDLEELSARTSGQATREELRELIRRLDRLNKELRRDHPDAAALLGDVKRTQREAILAFAEEFDEDAMEGFDV
jgi:MoxR-like ATPase